MVYDDFTRSNLLRRTDVVNVQHVIALCHRRGNRGGEGTPAWVLCGGGVASWFLVEKHGKTPLGKPPWCFSSAPYLYYRYERRVT